MKRNYDLIVKVQEYIDVLPAASSVCDARRSCSSPCKMAEQTDETLSRRAEVFRSKLIEEFQLLDCLSERGRQNAPVYSSSNIIEST